METMNIKQIQNTLNEGVEWGKTYIKEESEQYEFLRKMVDLNRSLDKISYALSERCAAATFGESQMGKSYLVNSMLSSPSVPFKVMNGERSYVFKTDINPSEANAMLEATGVVTRFTCRPIPDVPAGYLRAQMLSITDIILILSEAYYNEVDYINFNMTEMTNHLKEVMMNVPLDGNQNLLSEKDVLELEDYFKHQALSKKCVHILSNEVGYFSFLFKNISKLSEKNLIAIINLLWNENSDISKLFSKLIDFYKEIQLSSVVYVDFDAILKKYGTLIDVARLDEMFQPKPDVCPPEYKSTTNLILPNNKQLTQVSKSFLSALIAELTLDVRLEDNQNICPRTFLQNLDILDFPGACPDEQIKEIELCDAKKLTRVFRRGKVSFLFHKYSSAYRISTLLFCHNNHGSKYGRMGYVLTDWINRTIGTSVQEREEYISKLGIPPFFIIGTWFNTDLEYADKHKGDDLQYLWQRRFNAILSTDVLKINDQHWLNHWSVSQSQFQNIYMLRDFDHSKMIFTGYDPDTKSPENGYVENIKYPDFYTDLRTSFIGNDFVKMHFANPVLAWDNAATPTNDGTIPVMQALNQIAPNIDQARESDLLSKIMDIQKGVLVLLESVYESNDSAESIKKAKRLSGKINLSIDAECGDDPYFFGRLMDRIMIPESVLYEQIFTRLEGHQQPLPLTKKESLIFMNANLETGASREMNLDHLCAFLGVDTEEECREALEKNGIEMDNLLGVSKMVESSAEMLVTYIENYWYSTFLMGKCVNQFKDKLPFIGDVFKNLYILYGYLEMHKQIVRRVDKYIKELKDEVQTGIIADYLSMTFNNFIMNCGFSYIPLEKLTQLEAQSIDNNLNIDWALIKLPDEQTGITLLESLSSVMDKLGDDCYDNQVRKLQLALPQYRKPWLWQQKMRVALLCTCHISSPRYGVVANEKIGKIINTLK